ncbi:hypothetical protein COL5a_001841 [Colletotrichum fioriniae]|nr:hypothetical protein COL5a_001841 [Colletotrichum fioriniae]
MLSAAFSTKMLLDQEDIITKTVDAFVHRLGEYVFQSEGLNMTKWFEMIAFDSLGEMAIAGGETTATFLAAATYYLLRNPACLLRLQAEITDRFSSFEEINATAARQLPYLQAVINEGLRLYAPGSQGFPRLSPGMKVGDIYVPAGAEVFTHAWTLTHSEEYFSDPKSFKPERWLDAESADVREASQPFSMGPRGCLGQNFAYMEINLILAKMLWKYELELVDKELNWEQESQLHVMWWKPALMVRFTQRKS